MFRAAWLYDRDELSVGAHELPISGLARLVVRPIDIQAPIALDSSDPAPEVQEDPLGSGKAR